MEVQEIEYDDKMLILAEWLETSLLSISEILLDIEDGSGNEYSYDGETYLILNQDEVDDYLYDYSNNTINEIQRELDRSGLWYSHYLIIDEEAIKDDASAEQIGEYDEFKGYYIFTL